MILDWFLDPSEFHVLKSSLILDSAQREPPPKIYMEPWDNNSSSNNSV